MPCRQWRRAAAEDAKCSHTRWSRPPLKLKVNGRDSAPFTSACGREDGGATCRPGSALLAVVVSVEIASTVPQVAVLSSFPDARLCSVRQSLLGFLAGVGLASVASVMAGIPPAILCSDAYIVEQHPMRNQRGWTLAATPPLGVAGGENVSLCDFPINFNAMNSRSRARAVDCLALAMRFRHCRNTAEVQAPAPATPPPGPAKSNSPARESSSISRR